MRACSSGLTPYVMSHLIIASQAGCLGQARLPSTWSCMWVYLSSLDTSSMTLNVSPLVWAGFPRCMVREVKARI